jgi:hypothetical protein
VIRGRDRPAALFEVRGSVLRRSQVLQVAEAAVEIGQVAKPASGGNFSHW